MSTNFGITLNEVIPLTGFNVTRQENGVWIGQRDYHMLAASWNSTSIRDRFERGTDAFITDSDIPSFFSFLKVESVGVTYNEAGTVTLQVNYSGSQSGQYDDDGEGVDAIPTYRLEAAVLELPLSQHPKWKALSDDEQFSLGNLLNGRVVYGVPANETDKKIFWPEGNLFFVDEQVASENGVIFRDLIVGGTQTYFVPSIKWIEVTQGENGMTASQLNLLGKISTPRGGAPTPSGSRNWMLTSASQEQRGEIYQTTIEWTLSERGGWSTFLYS